MPALLNERKCGYCHRVKPMTDYESKLSYVCRSCQQQYVTDLNRSRIRWTRKRHGTDWMGKRATR